MVTNNFDWLATNQEPAVDPDQKIIDPHHHLWDARPDGPRLRYFLDELLEDTRDLNVRQTVFIECGAMYNADASEAMAPGRRDRVRRRSLRPERQRVSTASCEPAPASSATPTSSSERPSARCSTHTWRSATASAASATTPAGTPRPTFPTRASSRFRTSTWTKPTARASPSWASAD